MSKLDFHKSNPEIIGIVFELVKKHLDNRDPYFNIRKYYNDLFLKQLDDLEVKINDLHTAVKYAILGNIIDFSPINNQEINCIDQWFSNVDQINLTIDDVSRLQEDILKAKTILYLGDNCGEICLDKLLIKQIKKINPQVTVYFGVRGQPVVNDSISEDAYYVKMDEVATIVSNGDSSLGTVLERTSDEFRQIYNSCDFVIAKGQANLECLMEQKKKIYFLLMIKCQVMAQLIKVKEKSLICYCNQDK